MKRKILLLILIIFLILTLASCRMTSPSPGFSEETMARDVIRHYWRAIINRQYELAKYYCVFNGIWYNKTDKWEEYVDTNSEGEVSLVIFQPTLLDEIEIIENCATTHITVLVQIVDFAYGGITCQDDYFEYEIGLTKIRNWRLE